MSDRDEDDDNAAWTPDEPFVIPIEDFIDLHTFLPGETAVILDEYFLACREKGLLEVRVIHGKGTGQLRKTVWSFLARSPQVLAYEQAGPQSGGWGATMVRLKEKTRS